MKKSKTKKRIRYHTPHEIQTSKTRKEATSTHRIKSARYISQDKLPIKLQSILVLTLTLSTLTLIAISARAIHYQNIKFIYFLHRGRTLWYEFSNWKVTIPVTVMLLYATGLLATALVIANYNRRFNSKPYKKVMMYSFLIAWLLDRFSIFFGVKIS